MIEKLQVLFLCTGNSCRSQMAEALVNAHLCNTWQAYSAGTDPAGYVHPLAVKVLEEIGIKHQGFSKHVDEFKEHNFDLVITVCDAAAEACPLWLGRGTRIHCGFPDPAGSVGNEDEVLEVFRQVRNAISDRIPTLCRQFENGKIQ